MKNKHLNLAERNIIAQCIRDNKSKSEIARLLINNFPRD